MGKIPQVGTAAEELSFYQVGNEDEKNLTQTLTALYGLIGIPDQTQGLAFPGAADAAPVTDQTQGKPRFAPLKTVSPRWLRMKGRYLSSRINFFPQKLRPGRL